METSVSPCYKVRTHLLKNILSQDIAYFDSVNTGDLLSRLSYDCSNLTSPCNTVMSLAAQNFVVILGRVVPFTASKHVLKAPMVAALEATI
jgi:ABC-type multidrug transport system fused ATPase/permease subunit